MIVLSFNDFSIGQDPSQKMRLVALVGLRLKSSKKDVGGSRKSHLKFAYETIMFKTRPGRWPGFNGRLSNNKDIKVGIEQLAPNLFYGLSLPLCLFSPLYSLLLLSTI